MRRVLVKSWRACAALTFAMLVFACAAPAPKRPAEPPAAGRRALEGLALEGLGLVNAPTFALYVDVEGLRTTKVFAQLAEILDAFLGARVSSVCLDNPLYRVNEIVAQVEQEALLVVVRFDEAGGRSMTSCLVAAGAKSTARGTLVLRQDETKGVLAMATPDVAVFGPEALVERAFTRTRPEARCFAPRRHAGSPRVTS